MLDSTLVSICSKVNELADRYNIPPYGFTARVWREPAPECTVLAYETVHHGTDQQAFDGMLEAIGLGRHASQVRGDDREIIDTLDRAIRLARRSPDVRSNQNRSYNHSWI
jgi:hypothetical protein